MTRTTQHLLTCAAAAVAIGVAGCGGSSKTPTGAKLPASTVSRIDQRLDEIQRRYDSATKNDNPGACKDITSDSFPAITRLIDGLPAGTDQGIRDALTQSVSNLRQLTDSGCQGVGQRTTTTTTPTDTTTVPTTTTPTQTTTTPPQTTTTPPQTTTQTTPQNGSGGTNPGTGQGGSGNGTGQGGAAAPGN